MNKWTRTMVMSGLCGTLAVSPVWAQTQAEKARLAEQVKQVEQAVKVVAEKARQLAEESAYAAATAAMDSDRYRAAMEHLSQVLAMRGARYDAALYWKAYAESKLGQRPEALDTLQQLFKERAASRWVLDAKALEAEIRGAGGLRFKIETTIDDDLKLLVLNDLLHSHADEAIGQLEKMLEGSDAQKTKSLALFVLSQSGSPRARQMLVTVAKGGSNPVLQREAVSYLGMLGSKESHQALAEIYSVSKDNDVKRQVLRAYVVSGDRDRLLVAARGEADLSLRIEAVRALGLSGDASALIQLYSTPGQTAEVRKEIVGALFVRGDAKTLADIARKESDPKLKQLIEQRLEQMRRRDR